MTPRDRWRWEATLGDEAAESLQRLIEGLENQGHVVPPQLHALAEGSSRFDRALPVLCTLVGLLAAAGVAKFRGFI